MIFWQSFLNIFFKFKPIRIIVLFKIGPFLLDVDYYKWTSEIWLDVDYVCEYKYIIAIWFDV